jgi:hypothetical protein
MKHPGGYSPPDEFGQRKRGKYSEDLKEIFYRNLLNFHTLKKLRKKRPKSPNGHTKPY